MFIGDEAGRGTASRTAAARPLLEWVILFVSDAELLIKRHNAWLGLNVVASAFIGAEIERATVSSTTVARPLAAGALQLM